MHADSLDRGGWQIYSSGEETINMSRTAVARCMLVIPSSIYLDSIIITKFRRSDIHSVCWWI
jgi:hypothetical protein